jgi:SET domain-containing protein
MARFINHSCEPSCGAVVLVTPDDGARHILIYARRNIAAGEEITCDYQFPEEQESHCGTPALRTAESF